MTVPSLLQSTQKKELYNKLKKNYSVIQNALKRAQIDEGMMGDNEAIFNTSGTNYAAALKLSKYLNVIQICRDSADTGCKNLYYFYKYAQNGENINEGNNFNWYSAVVLNDGSIYKIMLQTNCIGEWDEVVNDSEGNPVVAHHKDDKCALVYVDVNGEKKPNTLGEDIFLVNIFKNNVTISNWGPYGGSKGLDILTNKK